MSGDPTAQSGRTERKKLGALRVFLIFLAVLVALAALGFALWGGGATPDP